VERLILNGFMSSLLKKHYINKAVIKAKTYDNPFCLLDISKPKETTRLHK
jgi:hypothetical protein